MGSPPYLGITYFGLPKSTIEFWDTSFHGIEVLFSVVLLGVFCELRQVDLLVYLGKVSEFSMDGCLKGEGLPFFSVFDGCDSKKDLVDRKYLSFGVFFIMQTFALFFKREI